jgi:hypothetical protein
MQDGCKVYMDSYVASSGSCWSLGVFQRPSLGGSLTQNQETMALQMFATVGLFYFIMCKDPHEIAFG